jgi:hypothetical protein
MHCGFCFSTQSPSIVQPVSGLYRIIRFSSPNRGWLAAFSNAVAFALLTACVTVTLTAVATAQVATAEEAAKVLDLRSFPLFDKEAKPAARTIASLQYEAAGSVAEAYEFQLRQLKEAGWKELDGGYATEQAASSTFSKAGFRLAVSVLPVASSGKVMVIITNLGNVEPTALPVPDNSQLLYSFGASTTYRCELAADAATEQTSAKLIQAGWQSYGAAGPIRIFKQAAVQLKVRIAAAPGQANATVIEFTSEQMSADLPALPDTDKLHYTESLRRLTFESKLSSDDVASQYRELLAKSGWEATTERPVKDKRESFQIFRNAAGDLLQLELRELPAGSRGQLKLQTADEVAAETKRLDELQSKKTNQPSKSATTSNIQLELSLPASAKNVEWSSRMVAFNTAAGKGKDAFAELRKSLREAGWKEDSATVDGLTGSVVASKDKATVSLFFVDVGVGAAEISLTASGVDLTQAAK